MQRRQQLRVDAWFANKPVCTHCQWCLHLHDLFSTWIGQRCWSFGAPWLLVASKFLKSKVSRQCKAKIIAAPWTYRMIQDDPGCIVDKADDRHAAAMLEAPHSITKKILLYSFKMARYGKMAWFSCRSPIFCCSSCVTFEAVGVESSVIASGTGLFVAKLMRNLAASEVWRYDEIWYDEICMEFVWIWIDM